MSRNQGEGANRLAVVGLALLAIVTLVLGFVAWKHARPFVPDVGETPGYSPSAYQSDADNTPEPEETEEGSETEAKPENTAPTTVPVLTRVLAAQDGNVAYRAVTGPCPESVSVIESTQDAGASWATTDMGAYGAVSSPLRLLPREDGYVAVASQNGDDCSTVVVLQSYDGGFNWEFVPDGAAVTWHLNPADPASVVVPQVGAVALPCEAARLATVSGTTATVLCTDTRLATTADAGANWVLSEAFPGADALSSIGESYLLTQAGVPGCDGTQVSRISGGQGVESVTCVAGTAAHGQTAISGAADGSAWLWAGDTLLKSSDGGVNWS